MAEAVFRHLVEKADLGSKIKIDSAGIAGWHAGKPPHEGTRAILEEKGINAESLKGRQLQKEDLEIYDYIVAMDHKNVSSIRELAQDDTFKVHLLTDFIDDAQIKGKEVPDPYHTGRFDETYTLVEAGCLGLLCHIEKQDIH